MYRLILILASIYYTSFPTESANILGIFPVRSKSHHSINQPIVKGLAAKGHTVTIISYFKSEHDVPNYTEILISELGSNILNLVDNIQVGDHINFVGVRNFLKMDRALGSALCDRVFGSQYVKQLLNSRNNTIDLIIVEAYRFKCFNLLAHKFNAPLINIFPTNSAIVGVDHFIGNPNNPSIVPSINSELTTKMNFLQRVQNFVHYLTFCWCDNFIFDKDLEMYAREVFDMQLPAEEELKKKTALTFYNNHFSFVARPRSPNVVDIAGVHIEESKKLPEDIEAFIDGSDHGVILVSFGSSIKVSSIPSEKLKIIVDAFSAIPQRVIWRVNELNITEVPPNVKVGRWFPQRDILEHKKVIAFISHCGLLGTFEAIHTATPIIAIPFVFDQFQNANVMVEKGAAIYVDYFSIVNKQTLIDAVDEISTNSKYSQNMRTLSRIFKDRPRSPLDEALYWSEYVLKHRGAPHLMTEAAKMPLYRYLLLDVLALILSIIVSILYFCKVSSKIVISRLRHRKLKK